MKTSLKRQFKLEITNILSVAIENGDFSPFVSKLESMTDLKEICTIIEQVIRKKID